MSGSPGPYGGLHSAQSAAQAQRSADQDRQRQAWTEAAGHQSNHPNPHLKGNAILM